MSTVTARSSSTSTVHITIEGELDKTLREISQNTGFPKNIIAKSIVTSFLKKVEEKGDKNIDLFSLMRI